MNKKTINHTPRGTRARRLRRLAAVGTAPVVVAAGLAASTAGAANATVGNLLPPDWGYLNGCWAKVGTVPDNYYRAIGGIDVTCNRYHSNITVNVSLWRWSGSQWQLAGTTGWHTAYNTWWNSQQTTPFSAGGCATWDITATVNVDGEQLQLDYNRDMKSWPNWNPTVGPC